MAENKVSAMTDAEIRCELVEKYGALPPETLEKLVISRRESLTMAKRPIRCPRCHRIIMQTSIHDHELVIVKCKYCRFKEPMDMALFRRIRPRLSGLAKGSVA